MKAVIMAGGEGTRLRPLTCDLPKPMVPILGKPVIAHGIDLLKKHGITDIAVTLMFMPHIIRNYLYNDLKTDVSIKCFVEEEPLGTAGSVKNAEEFLNEPFIILSGDALTNLDITKAIEFHKEKKAKVTLVLKKEKQPLSYGVVLTDKNGRIKRFIEKPNWSEVTADTINTGIYIIEPEILSKIPKGKTCDFGKELFPQLLKEQVPMYGYLTDAYWCDIGDISAYLQANKDAIAGRIKLDTEAVEYKPGIFMGKDVEIDADAELNPPLYIGSGTKIKKYSKLTESIIGENCCISSAEVLGSVIWNDVSLGSFATVRNSILCSWVKLGQQTCLQDGCVLGHNCRVEEFSSVAFGVNIWPNNIIEARSHVTEDIFHAPSTPYNFIKKNFTGILGEDIHPRMLQNLGMALGTLYKKVYLAQDGSNASAAAVYALGAGVVLAGGDACCCGDMILPVFRYIVRDQQCEAGIYAKDGGSLSLFLLDENGADLTRGQIKKIDDIISRGMYKIATNDTVGKLHNEKQPVEKYINYLRENIPVRGVGKVVLLSGDAYNTKTMAQVLNKLGWKVILHDKNVADISQCVLTNTACFGVVLNNQGEIQELYNEKGEKLYAEEVLYLYALLSAYCGAKKIAVPSYTSQETLQAITDLGLECKIARSDRGSMMQEIFSGDDEKRLECFNIVFDSLYFIANLIRYLSHKRTQLSELIPDIISKTVMYQIPCKNTDKGRIMMHFASYTDAQEEIPEGIKIKSKNGSVVILPDNNMAFCNVFAHSYNEEYAKELAMDYRTMIDEILKSGQS